MRDAFFSIFRLLLSRVLALGFSDGVGVSAPLPFFVSALSDLRVTGAAVTDIGRSITGHGRGAGSGASLAQGAAVAKIGGWSA